VKNAFEVMTKSTILVEHPFQIKDAMMMKQNSEGVFISGGTLIQLEWEAGKPLTEKLINLESIKELKGIEHVDHDGHSFIEIGSLTTISECIENPIIKENIPLLVETCKKIGAPAVRNRATLGGNVASGVGDTIPALLALNAEIIISLQDTIQTVKLWEWLQFQRKVTNSNFLLNHIKIPTQNKGDESFIKKVGRREAFTPALVTVSAQWKKKSADELEYIRIAVGGGNNNPRRLIKVEKILETNRCTEILLKSIHIEILKEFISYSDSFISESYRRKVAANLLVAELMNIFAGGEVEEE
jgi:xanthine dehydrogenase C subunit